jgi:hypothetical protein
MTELLKKGVKYEWS